MSTTFCQLTTDAFLLLSEYSSDAKAHYRALKKDNSPTQLAYFEILKIFLDMDPHSFSSVATGST